MTVHYNEKKSMHENQLDTIHITYNMNRPLNLEAQRRSSLVENNNNNK